MKRRQVLSGIAVAGLIPILNAEEKLGRIQNIDRPRNELDISDFGTRIFRDWAAAAVQPQPTRPLLGEVHADFLVTRSLTYRASDRAQQRAGYRVMAWQGVLLTALYTRLGDVQQARQSASVARDFGYQSGDRGAVASAYDRESIAEIWYGTPELGTQAAMRGVRVIQNEAETTHGQVILAGLYSQAMVHYARSPKHIELSRQFERQVLDYQQILPEIKTPNAFDLTPWQMYNSLAIAHAFQRHQNASELFAAGFRASASEAAERARFRKLVRLNQAWAEAPHHPEGALEIAADVLYSFREDESQADPIYRHRAARTIRALPESVPPKWTTELRTLISHPRV